MPNKCWSIKTQTESANAPDGDEYFYDQYVVTDGVLSFTLVNEDEATELCKLLGVIYA